MSALYNSPSPQPPLLLPPSLTPTSHHHHGGGGGGSGSSSSTTTTTTTTPSTQQQQQQQQYCLKWNNHRNNMVKVFNELLGDENFVDVTLACDGVSIKAHRLVLSACSTYFRDLFINNPCKHPIVILKDIHYEDLQAIIHFMYSGEVNVSYTQLAPLLKTAEALKIKGLTDVNEKHGNAFFNGTGQFPSNDISGPGYIPNGTSTPTTTVNDSMANFYNRMALESLTNQAIASTGGGGGGIADATNTVAGNGEPSNAYLAFMAQRFKKRRRKHKNGSALALANVFNNANGQ
ncbi:BTB/POZ domain containing protein [Euroglyphus maynei]|uniref:BTB/POZ domain containing protein n=1 Tax=Euroglyphus maynei TaxID=6958 RepID=A0A1Y3BCS3_EURMA|nr:BTB/POZ domain containing protein [Euroglyphus maynei]